MRQTHVAGVIAWPLCACPSQDRYLGMWLDLTTTHRQTWLFSCTPTYHSTDLLTARGVAHLVVHGTTGSTSYETIPSVRLESCGGVLSTVDMVVQRRDGPRRLRDLDDDTQDRKYMAYFTVFGRGPSYTGESDKVHTRVFFEIREQRDTQTQTRRLQYFAQLLGVT